ncbi:MAG TPA: PKD domain-containing protein, partial [Polyangiaceae bacterium]|nr:PKD domain-containing protein [Polyangiaceae bacterium]
MPRLAAALGFALALAALALALWPQRPARRPGAPATAPAEATAPPEAAPEPRRLPAGNALAAALGEEQVALASGVVVEAVEQDAPWACAGEPLGLFARVGGDAEPGAITRWLWPGEAGVELSPGATLSWRAPRAPGRYPVRVQVCKDLGGRQVGVLAERVHEIDVRSCDAASRGALRLLVTRLAVGAFAFEATRAEGEAPAHYLWDFDDGSPPLEAGPRVEHVFAAPGLGPHDVRAFAVRASGHLPGAEPLEATAFAVVRGRPAPRDAPPVELD